jgi:hypothetical protein
MTSDLERLARVLCKLDGHPENIKFEGKPMWASYVPTVRALLSELRNPSDEILCAAVERDGSPRDPFDAWQAQIDSILAEGV